MAGQISWREESLGRTREFEAFAREARAAFPGLELSRDVAWLSRHSGCALKVMSARVDGRLVGFAPLEVHSARLRFGFGEVTLAGKRVQRHALEGEPPLRDDVREEGLNSFFEALAERLDSNAAVFLRGVPEDSVVNALLNDRHSRIRANFHVVPHGPPYMRCRIRWEGSFETYLESLGKVTRKDLRRTLRKAEACFGSACRLERFTTVDDVPRFLRLAAAVSEKTYQRRLLGEGVSDSERDRALLEDVARSNRLLGHILLIDEEPAAFHLGHFDGQCFCMTEAGYDPKWAKAQIGMLTFLLMLKDLETHKVPVTMLDYLYGGGVYKERTSHLKTPERHFYLIKKTAIGTVVATAMVASDATSRQLGQMLDTVGLKDWMKRQVRRRRSWGTSGIATHEIAAYEVLPKVL